MDRVHEWLEGFEFEFAIDEGVVVVESTGGDELDADRREAGRTEARFGVMLDGAEGNDDGAVTGCRRKTNAEIDPSLISGLRGGVCGVMLVIALKSDLRTKPHDSGLGHRTTRRRFWGGPKAGISPQGRALPEDAILVCV